MKITACPKCGSTNISAGNLGSGIIFGVTSWKELCRNCGYQGQPISFDSEDEYLKFLEEIKQKPIKKDTKLRETPSVENQVDEVINIPKKDREVVKLLKEYENEKEPKPIWPKNKKWWPEIVLSLIFAAVIYYSGFARFISIMGMESALILNTLNFIIYFVEALLIIVIIEFFLRLIINTLSN